MDELDPIDAEIQRQIEEAKNNPEAQANMAALEAEDEAYRQSKELPTPEGDV